MERGGPKRAKGAAKIHLKQKQKDIWQEGREERVDEHTKYYMRGEKGRGVVQDDSNL